MHAPIEGEWTLIPWIHALSLRILIWIIRIIVIRSGKEHRSLIVISSALISKSVGWVIVLSLAWKRLIAGLT